ncbi:uncharacterized protein LOC142981647 [Anticarsia gemmatalis]|uniref:uncharacterized protein LOC142981647 n=1 Tax=Anticarsia gemmatalis TaxID=129554 RepID=UPI003F75B47D
MSLTHMTGTPYGLSGIQPGHHRHATLTHPGHRNASSRLTADNKHLAPTHWGHFTAHRTPTPHLSDSLELAAYSSDSLGLAAYSSDSLGLAAYSSDSLGLAEFEFRLTGTHQCMALERLTDMKRRSTYGLRGSDVAARYIQRHLPGPARNQPPRAV